MSRVEINFPEKQIFTTEIPVRITDLNYGNHLGNDSLVSILHEARVRFFSTFGYTELNVEGAGTIMSDLIIQYKSEGNYGEMLRIDLAIGDISRVSFDVFYKVSVGDRLVAIAKTGIVFFDYEQKKVLSVPHAFRSKLG